MASLQLQAAMGFAVADFGEVSTVRYSTGLSAVVPLNGCGGRCGPFLSAGAGIDLLSDNGTDVQWLYAFGVGYRKPMGDRFLFRPQIELARTHRSDRRLAATTLSFVVGFSILTGGGSS
jgi:hypothetical protein